MARLDISPSLVHFTRGAGHGEAFGTLKKIIVGRKLFGTTTNVKGGYHCICFSEAPLATLEGGLVNERDYSHYSSFGVLISKKWLFELGGRPAIYQTEEEYHHLPPSHQWRHVRYDIREGRENVDFTWEREWRIQSNVLEIGPSVSSLVVPNAEWAKRLIRDLEEEENFRVRQYSLVLGAQQAEMYREPFRWEVLTLR